MGHGFLNLTYCSLGFNQGDCGSCINFFPCSKGARTIVWCSCSSKCLDSVHVFCPSCQNVFLGFLLPSIHAPLAEWNVPFGFNSAAQQHLVVCNAAFRLKMEASAFVCIQNIIRFHIQIRTASVTRPGYLISLGGCLLMFPCVWLWLL